MRLLFVGSSLACAAFTLAVGACSEEEAGNTNPQSFGDNDGGRIDTTPEPNDAASAGSRRPPRSPDGCVLKSTGFKVGAKAENVTRTSAPSAQAWTNPTGARDIDQAFAQVTLNDGEESAELRVSDFGLAVPESALTWGIEAELKRQAPQGGVEDGAIDITVENQVTGPKKLVGPWPKTIVGTHVYGQAVDTWRVDLNPSDVNKPTFALRLWVKRMADAGAGPVSATVESLKVAIWYCPK